MKIPKEKRQNIADAQKITSSIAKRLQENKQESEKVDLTKLAEQLADRRTKILKEEE